MSMVIPYEMLKQETLDNLIEHYITTEWAAANNGEIVDMETKKKQVMANLKRERCVVEYSETNESPYIVSADKFKSV